MPGEKTKSQSTEKEKIRINNMLTQSTTLPRLSKAKGFILGSLMAGLALAYPAMAGDQVQYKGEEVGVVTKGAFQFPFAHASTTAKGEAVYIGHYTLTGDFTVDVRFGTATGVFTLTSANGDMLFLDMEGHAVPTNLTKTVANFTVTGGTGRFEGATGSFAADNQFDFAVNLPSPNPYDAAIDVAISPPAAKQH